MDKTELLMLHFNHRRKIILKSLVYTQDEETIEAMYIREKELWGTILEFCILPVENTFQN